MTPDKLKELIAAAQAKALAAKATMPAPVAMPMPVAAAVAQATNNEAPAIEPPQPVAAKLEESWTWHPNQLRAIELARTGRSFVMIGAAGTGKTTVTKAISNELIDSGVAGILQEDTKFLAAGSPGIVAVSFTRRAVRNLRKAMPASMKDNCITIHKLLEYEPVFYSIFDPITKMERKTMRFEPQRHAWRKLPTSIHTIIFDETSMVGTELHQQIIDALPNPGKVQFIYIGDLYQLPPVFGPAVLGFKMLELEVVELTHVYRQALESPIIALATALRRGETDVVALTEKLDKATEKGRLVLHPWKKAMTWEDALLGVNAFFRKLIEQDKFSPENDVVLCPFNVKLGTDELNKNIAQHLGYKRNAVVFEVISGFLKHYFAAGDRVLHDREDAVITAIERNPAYIGPYPQKESTELSRYGHYMKAGVDTDPHKLSDDELDELLLTDDTDERKQEASHKITLRMLETDATVVISSAGDVNALTFAYALTVHKAQGSEWHTVYVVLHNSHNVMLNRELLYTALTRARMCSYIICEPDRSGGRYGSLLKAATNPRIKGDTLEEKAKHFRGLEKLKAGAARMEEERRAKQLLLQPAWEAAELVRPFIESAFQRCVQKIQEFFPEFKVPKWELKPSGSAAGYAYYMKNLVTLNPIYMMEPEHVTHILDDTLPHELAHLVAYQLHGPRDGTGHGPRFYEAGRKMGLDLERCHHMGTASEVMSKMFEAAGITSEEREALKDD